MLISLLSTVLIMTFVTNLIFKIVVNNKLYGNKNTTTSHTLKLNMEFNNFFNMFVQYIYIKCKKQMCNQIQ